jgi:hypothetical protein
MTVIFFTASSFMGKIVILKIKGTASHPFSLTFKMDALGPQFSAFTIRFLGSPSLASFPSRPFCHLHFANLSQDGSRCKKLPAPATTAALSRQQSSSTASRELMR